MNEVKISIVVPVYNSEKYLPACIDSILDQTFTNFELLLINDASKDNSLQICIEYANRDNRIKVFNREINGGEASSRNVGLDNATGDYIVFIDSDDTVLKNHLQSLYYSSDIPSGTLVHAPHLISTNGIITGSDENVESYLIENLFVKIERFDFLFAGPSWSKMLETSVIRKNNLRFRAQFKMNVDHIFHLEYLMFINAYKNVGEKTLIYFNRPESVSKKHFPFEELFERANLMIPLTNSVIERFKIEDRDIQINLYFTPVNAIVSSIFALYRSPFRKNQKDRIIGLNKVLTSFYIVLKDFWVPNDISYIAIKKILNTRNLYFIDVCMSIIITFRYSLFVNKYIMNRC